MGGAPVQSEVHQTNLPTYYESPKSFPEMSGIRSGPLDTPQAQKKQWRPISKWFTPPPSQNWGGGFESLYSVALTSMFAIPFSHNSFISATLWFCMTAYLLVIGYLQIDSLLISWPKIFSFFTKQTCYRKLSVITIELISIAVLNWKRDNTS